MKSGDAQVCGSDVAARGDTRRDPMRTAQLHLTGTTADGTFFRHDLLTLYVKNQLGAARALPVLAGIVACSSLIWVPPAYAVLWLSIVLISQGIILLLCQKFERLDDRAVDVDEWGRIFAAAEFFAAICWAILIFAFWESPNAVEQVYLIAVLMVVASIKMALASHFLPVVHAGTLPITAAVIVRCVADGGPLFMFLAIMAVCAEIYFVQLVRKLNETALRMLEFRAEKDALIAELEQAKAKSDEARYRAESANLAKSRFLATVSHELRTPLNAITGFSEVMKRELLGRHEVDAYKDYSDDIHRSGEHLLSLIDEILDLSRIEAGRYTLKEAPVRLSAMMSDCRDLLALRADERSLKIVEHFPAGVPDIAADPVAVRQIILNLMSNAIKFTPEGGTITLAVYRSGDGGVTLSVKDNGPGIPREELPTVLSSFGQGSLAQHRAEAGAGLGLPIVQGLAALHDAEFELKSNPGEGTEAVVAFPQARTIVRPEETALTGT